MHGDRRYSGRAGGNRLDRNVMIVIILTSVSALLAAILISAILCMIRPCGNSSTWRRSPPPYYYDTNGGSSAVGGTMTPGRYPPSNNCTTLSNANMAAHYPLLSGNSIMTGIMPNDGKNGIGSYLTLDGRHAENMYNSGAVGGMNFMTLDKSNYAGYSNTPARYPVSSEVSSCI